MLRSALLAKLEINNDSKELKLETHGVFKKKKVGIPSEVKKSKFETRDALKKIDTPSDVKTSELKIHKVLNKSKFKNFRSSEKSKWMKKVSPTCTNKIIATSSKVQSKRELKINRVSEFDSEIQELERKFRVNADVTKKAVQGIITLTSGNPKLKNRLFDNERFPLFLQVNSVKVPNVHSRIVRIPLKHSILTSDSEVCLIVADVKGIPNKNHEQHLEYYEKLLSDKEVNCIKKIMTFHEFRTEYETFELKNRLVELYDAFLVEGKISGKTVSKCGKIFYKKRKIPTAIKLQATKLKEHIASSLNKASLYLHGNGDSFIVQIGHNKMAEKEIVENIFYVLKGLDKEFPGGFANVRNLNLFTFRGITFPIYISLKNKNKVNMSKNANPQPQRGVKICRGVLSTKLNSGVIVKPTGEVTVFPLDKKKKKELHNEIKPSTIYETHLKEKNSGQESKLLENENKKRRDSKAQKRMVNYKVNENGISQINLKKRKIKQKTQLLEDGNKGIKRVKTDV